MLTDVLTSEPGTDRERIRAAYRSALSAYPDCGAEEFGGDLEERFIDVVVASQGSTPAIRLSAEMAKHAWRFMQTFRGSPGDG